MIHVSSRKMVFLLIALEHFAGLPDGAKESPL
jgi:hypothetical protein